MSRVHSYAPSRSTHSVLTHCSQSWSACPVLTHFWSPSPLCCTSEYSLSSFSTDPPCPGENHKVTSQSPGGIPASDLSHVHFISHIPTAFKSGPNQATSVPIPSWDLLFHCSPKKTGKDFSFSMTGDSSTWLCLCSLGSLYCVHLEHTAEIPKKRFLFSLSSHLYSATTFLPKHQAPQQILQHNFPGYHEPLL